MVGTVIKLEAKVADPYGTKTVVGTNVTVEHTVYVGDDKEKKVESTVFMVPNSELPHIGDDLDVTLNAVF